MDYIAYKRERYVSIPDTLWRPYFFHEKRFATSEYKGWYLVVSLLLCSHSKSYHWLKRYPISSSFKNPAFRTGTIHICQLCHWVANSDKLKGMESTLLQHLDFFYKEEAWIKEGKWYYLLQYRCKGSQRYPRFGSVRVTSTRRKMGCKLSGHLRLTRPI